MPLFIVLGTAGRIIGHYEATSSKVVAAHLGLDCTPEGKFFFPGRGETLQIELIQPVRLEGSPIF